MMTPLRSSYFYFLFILVIIAFLLLFFTETFTYELMRDDWWMKDLLVRKNFSNAVAELYLTVNGRWFSHIWDCLIFRIFFNHYEFVFLYQLFILVVFVLSLALFIKVSIKKIHSVEIPAGRSLFLSLTLTALFFFFLFEGREEVWYWITASGVHLLSLIALLIVLSYAAKDTLTLPEKALMSGGAVAIGGMSEAYAVMGIIILLLGTYRKYVTLSGMKWTGGLILFSLLLNILSSGLQSRLNMLPDFNLFQAIKNTIHSLLLPFIRYPYLPVKAGVLIFTYVLSGWSANQDLVERKKIFAVHFLKQLLVAIGIIFVSFFIHCYLLTDIVAYRMESFEYLFFLLFVFIYFIKYKVSAGK